jgi:putative spermidine/putrescine transport system substrate-binding protein
MRLWITRLLAMAVIACWSGTGFAQQPASGTTIVVGNYGGVFTATQRKYGGALFTRRTGAQVQYIDANPADHLAKMIAMRGREAPYDVVYLDVDIQAQAIKAGVLEKLDPAAVPNVQYVYDQAKNKEGYGPAMMIYTIGIAYNKEKFAAAGIPAPTSWADLWDPRLAGKVVIPDLSSVQGRAFLIAAARLAGGGESDLAKGIDKIAQLKYHSIYTASAQVEALFPTGDVWAAPFSNGRSWALIDKGLPLGYVLPKEGAIVGLGTLDVVKGSKHPKEGFAYINAVLDPLPQLGQAYEVPFGPTNKLLAPILADYPDVSKKFTTSLDEPEKHNLYIPNWSAYWASSVDPVELWNRKVGNR